MSRHEWAWLQEQRRSALRDAVERTTGGIRMPVAWRWGWKAEIHVLGRNRDGSLSAFIRCYKRGRKVAYVRNLRGEWPGHRKAERNVYLRLAS